MHKAVYFKHVSIEDLNTSLAVNPPYESKGLATGQPAQWVRGYMRLGTQDFIVTGPKMRVCYSGCRWNKLVFCLNGAADPEVYAFERWLHEVNAVFRSHVEAMPERFKPGAKTATRFLFDDDYIKPSSDPAMYPDELRCRLSTHRQMVVDQTSADGAPYQDVVDTHLFKVDAGLFEGVEAGDIKAGMEIIPIIRISYYRNIERFGLALTVLKGQVFEGDSNNQKPTNMDWVIDYPYN